MSEINLAVSSCKIKSHVFNTLVVGSGAAGLSAAEYLARRGQTNIAIITEGMKKGTSRNGGSDKQTYYKLNLCGGIDDSVRKMAECLFSGGCMDGDIAMAEAALSARGFFRLVELGVPFPHNAQGEFIGYKTDHDPAKRGTSAGPLTSRYMTECLQTAVEKLKVPVFDRMQVIEILTAGADAEKRACGVLALNLDQLDDPDNRYVLFGATNVIYATGAEAGMYESSVYPSSQSGSTGVAFRAGVWGKNLTESQYGLASTKFRWNLSGTYQQVLPRYVSMDKDGKDEREFLDPFFSSTPEMLTAIFLKGYQWPFDPRKTGNHGSSLIDILVHEEMVSKERRVFLDYTRNPAQAERNGELDYSLLEREVKEYLSNSSALLPSPIERLRHMNPAAVALYRNNGIDLGAELLEIAVCAQHNNGGLSGDRWWQSNIGTFFPIGEVNGTHGIYRPGGSALNSDQVGTFGRSTIFSTMVWPSLWQATPLPRRVENNW
jgi:succinate dehydrogenase/fumarate reductase flavoprotein subunit